MGRFNLKVRVSLAGLAEGWTDQHFFEFRPFNAEDSLDSSADLKKIDDGDMRGHLEVFKKYATKQFIGGKVLVSGKVEDAIAEDLDEVPGPVLTAIFTAISRSDFSDPKVSR